MLDTSYVMVGVKTTDFVLKSVVNVGGRWYSDKIVGLLCWICLES